jgi:hypothetical protein
MRRRALLAVVGSGIAGFGGCASSSSRETATPPVDTNPGATPPPSPVKPDEKPLRLDVSSTTVTLTDDYAATLTFTLRNNTNKQPGSTRTRGTSGPGVARRGISGNSEQSATASLTSNPTSRNGGRSETSSATSTTTRRYVPAGTPCSYGRCRPAQSGFDSSRGEAQKVTTYRP